jgi:hypothetical protein
MIERQTWINILFLLLVILANKKAEYTTLRKPDDSKDNDDPEIEKRAIKLFCIVSKF